MTEALHRKYRPTTFDQLYGHKTVVDALVKQLEAGRQNTFLLTGPTGTGKTTLGRIIAAHVGCEPTALTEIDAATNNGKDDARRLIDTARYRGFGADGIRVFIIDECHEITKPAWQALLKTLEEPLDEVFFILCTTEVSKVPATIKTRCAHYDLKPLHKDDMFDLLDDVAGKEGIEVTDAMLDAIIREAGGSPRQALQFLSKAEGVGSVEELRELMDVVSEEDGNVIELARLLLFPKGRPTMGAAIKIINGLKDQNPESIRIVISNYAASCLLGAKKEADMARMLDVLNAFSGTFNTTDKMAPVLLACGDLLMRD